MKGSTKRCCSVLFLLLDSLNARERDSENAFQVSKLHNLNHFQVHSCYFVFLQSIALTFQYFMRRVIHRYLHKPESWMKAMAPFLLMTIHCKPVITQSLQFSCFRRKVHLSLQLLLNLILLPLRLCPKHSHSQQLLLSEEVTALRVSSELNLNHQKHTQQWRCGCQRRNQGTLPCLVLCHTEIVSYITFPRISPKQGG